MMIFEKWKTVEEVAARLGVESEAVRKWRERKAVPGRWHLALIKASKGKIKMDDFDE